MWNTIIEKLKALPCEAWELTETREERWEFYFIGRRLDQNRSVRIRETEVKIYQGVPGEFLGSALGIIPPTATDKEIDEALERLLMQASLVKNPYYKLTDTPVSTGTDDISGEPDVAAIAQECIRALAEVPEDDPYDEPGGETAGEAKPGEGSGAVSRINSYEIFVSGITRHMRNSNGVEYTCSYPRTEMEVVINAKEGGHEIEMQRIYHSGTCDRNRLEQDITRLMQFGRDRLSAQPTPRLSRGDVLFSTEDAVSIYEYFVKKMHADYVVRGLSGWKIGEPVSGGATGDRVSMEIVPKMHNSSMNYPVDREGNEIFPRWLIRDGIAENYCGSRQFSQYLGLEKSSLVTNVRFLGGRMSEEQIRGEDYLEVVEFSDFQVDTMSGDIAGEIRLGYLHRDGKIQTVTGGSVSGSMNDAARDMLFSKETVQYDNREIPRVTLLKGLRITGV